MRDSVLPINQAYNNVDGDFVLAMGTGRLGED